MLRKIRNTLLLLMKQNASSKDGLRLRFATSELTLIVLAILFFLPGFVANAANDLKAQYDQHGLKNIIWNDSPQLTKPADVTLLRIFTTKNGVEEKVLLKRKSSVFDPETKTLTQEYGELTLKVRYSIVKSRLDMRFTIINNMKESTILPGYMINCRFPFTTSTGEYAIRSNQFSPFSSSALPDRELVLSSPDYKTIQFTLHKNFLRIITKKAPEIKTPIVDASLYKLPERGPIPPGDQDSLSLSLQFIKPEENAADACADLIENIAKNNKMSLKWDDRRPIGIDFLCSAFMRIPGNPRGWFNDRKLDIRTDEGLEQFKKRMFERVEKNIANLKELDAQGIILWDIEGQEFYHPISYIGDPRMLAETTPEMNTIIDEIFKRYRDAGFKVGICIRPSKIVEDTSERGMKHTKKTGRKAWKHVETKNPIENMIDKIAYAKNRWGVTIYYLDSNVNGTGVQDGSAEKNVGVPWVIPGDWMKAVHEAHPDVLVIPEWNNLESAPYTAPFRSCNLGQVANPLMNRLLYPGSFAVATPSERLIQEKRDDYLQGVLDGDIMLCSTWYRPVILDDIKLIRKEATFLRAGMPEEVANAASDSLRRLSQASDESTRYWCAVKCGALDDKTSGDVLSTLTKDSSFIVRKKAIGQLKNRKNILTPDMTNYLVEIITSKNRDLRPFMLDACRALGSGGETTAPLLTGMILRENVSYLYPRRELIQALGKTGTTNPEAIKILTSILRSDDPKIGKFAKDALIALKDLDAKNAIEPILSKRFSKDPHMAMEIAKAAQKLGDKRAVETCVKMFKRTQWGVVIYRYRQVLNEVLWTLTGAYQPDWIAWYNQLPENEKNQYRMDIERIDPPDSPFHMTDDELDLSSKATYSLGSDADPQMSALFANDFLKNGVFADSAFKTKKDDPSVVIDLGKQENVIRIAIANKLALYNRSKKSETLEVFGSLDGKTWERLWRTSDSPSGVTRFYWNIRFKEPRKARYIKIIETKPDIPLELERVRIIGKNVGND